MPPTLAERILVHLAAYPIDENTADVPRQVTQEGIADALGAQVAHVSRALKHLVQDGFVTAHLAHPQGGTRRARAHALTKPGLDAARAIPAIAVARALPRSTAAHPRVPAGRTTELDGLLGALEDVRKGGPRLVLIEGDAGSGKTRLLEAFAHFAEERGARVLVARGMPTGEEQLVGPLSSALAPLGFERRYRARSVGAPRERALSAATEALVSAAHSEPVTLVLDDLHYAGASVADFLHGLHRALPHGTRVLIVAAFRREEEWALPNGPLYTALMPVRDAPGAKLIELEPLERAGVAALLQDAGVHVLGETRLPADLVDRVWRESGGNAAFALAMGAELADGVDEEDFFPKSVRAAAKERFASLGEPMLAVLQAAAVAGPEVDYRILARCHEGPEDALVATLDHLIDKLLLEEAATVGTDDLRLRFRHPKVREAVLADLTATRRRWLEARVAEAHQR
jgi:hypothetical protein